MVKWGWVQGCGVVRSRRVLGGVGVGFFCPTPTPVAQLDHFLHHTPKMGIPVEMVQFLLKLLLKQSFFAVWPWFPLILTAKFHSLYVKESGVRVWNFGKIIVGNFGKSESSILPPTLQPCQSASAKKNSCSTSVKWFQKNVLGLWIAQLNLIKSFPS